LEDEMTPDTVALLPKAAFGCVLLGLVVHLAIIDSRRMILPNSLNANFAAGGLAQSVVTGQPALIDALLGAIAGAAVLACLAAVFRRVRGIDGLGGGDLKFVAAAGLWIGWQDMSWMLLIAALSALGFVAVQGMRSGQWQLGTGMPFGPFLGIGTIA